MTRFVLFILTLWTLVLVAPASNAEPASLTWLKKLPPRTPAETVRPSGGELLDDISLINCSDRHNGSSFQFLPLFGTYHVELRFTFNKHRADSLSLAGARCSSSLQNLFNP